jgi:hypothetical protein
VYPKGTDLLLQGCIGDCFYVIAMGVVSVRVNVEEKTDDGDGGGDSDGDGDGDGDGDDDKADADATAVETSKIDADADAEFAAANGVVVDKTTKIVKTLSVGDHFGEMAIISRINDKRSMATVRAETDVEVYQVGSITHVAPVNFYLPCICYQTLTLSPSLVCHQVSAVASIITYLAFATKHSPTHFLSFLLPSFLALLVQPQRVFPPGA